VSSKIDEKFNGASSVHHPSRIIDIIIPTGTVIQLVFVSYNNEMDGC